MANKLRLYTSSISVVGEFLDITQIIHKVSEIEKLKIVLFNHQQLALFDFISKELISLEKSKDLIGEYRQLNADKENLAKLILDFKQKYKVNNTEMKGVDKKLYDLLNQEFKYDYENNA